MVSHTVHELYYNIIVYINNNKSNMAYSNAATLHIITTIGMACYIHTYVATAVFMCHTVQLVDYVIMTVSVHILQVSFVD